MPKENIEDDNTRYNLRSKKRPASTTAVNFATNIIISVMLMITFLRPGMATPHFETHPLDVSRRAIRCIPGGVALEAHNITRYESCAEEYCQVEENPNASETILLPPEISLHEYQVQWKFFDGKQLEVLGITCQSSSCCQNIRCWFCTANIFNPECSPRRAIAVTVALLYITIATLYLICCVPLVIGRPIRILFRTWWICVKGIVRITSQLWTICWRRRRHHKQQEIESLLRAPLIAACIASFITVANGCRNVDVLEQQTTICSYSARGVKECVYETMEIFKLNSFEQTACIRLLNNQSLVKEIRFQWKGLRMTCAKKSILFTRNTKHEMVDSKRCAHSGSCVADKCANLNASSIVPELERGNKFPGVTRCVESCGGPGCGGFYLSSGCLFYRIFYVPVDDKVYEIFKCRQWEEEVNVEVTIITAWKKRVRKKIYRTEAHYSAAG